MEVSSVERFDLWERRLLGLMVNMVGVVSAMEMQNEESCWSFV